MNEGITSVEFFNQHVKHLLLEKDKFKEHSVKIAELSTGIKEIRDAIRKMSLENTKDASELRKIMSLINSEGTQEGSPVFDTLKEEIGQLKEHMTTLHWLTNQIEPFHLSSMIQFAKSRNFRLRRFAE